MNNIPDMIRNADQEGCVTILMNTHRSKPGYLEDQIVYKNLLKEAENKLYERFEKRFVWPIAKNLAKVSSGIDFSHNLDSLVVFANKDITYYVTLPVTVEDRVIIDSNFATRDIMRALARQFRYYLLVLDKDKASLYEAYNNTVVREIKGEFPLENPLYTADRFKRTNRQGQDNLIEEFFNQTDKAVWDAVGDDPRPLLVASESRNFDYYFSVTDKKYLILGNINLVSGDTNARKIVEEAWHDITALIGYWNDRRLNEVDQAAGENKIVTELDSIWEAINQGRAKTLFIDSALHQPAVIDGDILETTNNITADRKGYIDDIIDEMAEATVEKGGEVVFLDGGNISNYNGIVLIERY